MLTRATNVGKIKATQIAKYKRNSKSNEWVN